MKCEPERKLEKEKPERRQKKTEERAVVQKQIEEGHFKTDCQVREKLHKRGMGKCPWNLNTDSR